MSDRFAPNRIESRRAGVDLLNTPEFVRVDRERTSDRSPELNICAREAELLQVAPASSLLKIPKLSRSL